MLRKLRRHPFGVQAFFKRSLVLTYAMPARVLSEFLYPGLVLDTYGDWGFLAIAMVETEQLRPSGFPKWLGRSFFLSGYRVFTRIKRPGRSDLRGLRILRSDTDRRLMATLGNLFTHYNYRIAKVAVDATADQMHVVVRTPKREADIEVVAALSSLPAALPEGTPFSSVQEARTFAGPLPFTFSYDERVKSIVVIKGTRTSWDPQPVQVDVREATFLKQPRFAGADVRLANAFYLQHVDYAWRPGELVAVS